MTYLKVTCAQNILGGHISAASSVQCGVPLSRRSSEGQIDQRFAYSSARIKHKYHTPRAFSSDYVPCVRFQERPFTPRIYTVVVGV